MIEIYAHRGLHRTCRENTLEAFAGAVALGVDGVELDVRQTLDGELVVNHDPRVESMVIAETRYAALPSYVATLESVLDVLGDVRANVEIKNIKEPGEPTYDATGAFARGVVAVIAASPSAHPYVVSCFDEATCALVRAVSQVEVAWLLWGVDLSSALVRARALGLNAVNPHFATVSSAAMDQAAQLGLGVNVWTVNEAHDIRAMLELGVSSIITDDPALAMQIREEGPRYVPVGNGLD